MGNNQLVFISALTFGIISCILAGKVLQFDVDSEAGQIKWLIHYGHMDNYTNSQGSSPLLAHEAFVKAVKQVQRFLRMPETGVVSASLKKFMKTGRCGMTDMNDLSMFTRRKRRYALQGSQYAPGKLLTYRINVYSTKLPQFTQDQIFTRAFSFWSNTANIKFQQVFDTSQKVDIDIMFVTGSHGDYEAFDGRGGILAHAFFPSFGGNEHFDDDESWTHEKRYGTNMFQTVTHEIGHSLGLSHSNDPQSIMFPYIKPYDRDFKLGKDDVMGIQQLYGKADQFIPRFTMNPNIPRTMAPPPQITPAPTPSPPNEREMPRNFCFEGGIDAVTQTNQHETYIFRGQDVYKISGLGVAENYPVRIDDLELGFSPLVGPIDAALYWPTTGITYLFKDYYVAAFNGRTFIQWYFIDDLLKLPNEAKGMDTVFHWPRNGKTYVTKGQIYWRFETGSGQMDPGYPQPMSKWSLPWGVDAAFEYSNGRTYFFTGNQYYKFDDVNIKLAGGYPRHINYWWFGCRSNAASQGASQGLLAPEKEENDQQMKVIQPVEVNFFTDKENKSMSSRTHASVFLIGGLLLCLLRLNNNIWSILS